MGSGLGGRQAVTAALGDLGIPARARLVADYAEARFGASLSPRMLATLRRDERRAWAAGTPRPTYISPALEGRFFQPVRALYCLADWELERRLMGPWSERADHLAATAEIARQVVRLRHVDGLAAERLAGVLADLARSLSGPCDASLDPAEIEVLANAEWAMVAERDGPWRANAAARAREALNEMEQVWGTKIGAVA